MDSTLYTKDDIGCYADGSLGLENQCKRLAGLVEDFADSNLVDALRTFVLSDDHSEIDDATDLLQDRTETGCYWEWRDGDLLLIRRGCDSCDALVINGLFTHEFGCPNRHTSC